MGRGREGPDEVLKNYQGYLQTDGYQVYDRYEEKEGIVLLHCMAHARRYFIEAADSDPDRSNHMLALFQNLYLIERSIKEEGLSGVAIVSRRKQQAEPILLEMKQWMEREYPKVLPKSPVGKAIAYCLPRWAKLMRYTQSERLKIDNNPVENQIRPLAVGRKNYLFCGSHEAAQRAAMVYSLLGTCKLLGIDPYQWLKEVLQTIHLYTSSNLNLLLPINWLNLKNQ